jgi:soluble lytic murein transglycosylase-like protein
MWFMIKKMHQGSMKQIACMMGIAAAMALSGHACADIYSFTDETGVTHFSNLPDLDRRYRLVERDIGGGAAATAVHRNPSAADIAKYSPIIDKAARDHELDPRLLHAVIRVESAYDARAVSVKGARGLMQLIPDTARRYGVTDVFDPAENVHAGARHLKDLLATFNNNLELALAAYNAGEGAVIRAGNRIPKYRETLAYVPKVVNIYRSYRIPRS